MSTLLSRLEQVRTASRRLNLLDESTVNAILLDVAAATDERADFILSENARDLALMDKPIPSTIVCSLRGNGWPTLRRICVVSPACLLLWGGY